MPTFQDTGKEFAVNRRDLRRLHYTETVFGRGYAPDPAMGTHTPLYQIDGWRGGSLPIFTFSSLELVPHF